MQAGKETFEQAWPELSRRLQGTLRSRGVSSWLVDDIVQETGLRLFKRWESVDPELSPWGLTLTIAKNLLWDTTHRQASREMLVDVPERAASHDVADAGIARLELWRVARAMGRMSPRYRSVLLAEVGGEEPLGASAAATKMTRMRARKRLNAILEGASASCLTAMGTMRRWAFDVQQLVRRTMPVLEGSASVTVAALVGAVVVMVPGTAITSPRQETTTSSRDKSFTEQVLLREASDRQVVSAPDLRREVSRPTSDPSANKPAAEDATRHQVSVGNDVGGSAGVEIRKKEKSDELFRPECGVEHRPSEVYASCTIHSRDESYKAEALVRIHSSPDK